MTERGKTDPLEHDQRRARRPNSSVRLERLLDKAVFGGVAAGIAAFVGASPFTVRLLFVVTSILSAGVIAVAYLLLWVLLPVKGAA